MKKGTSTLMVSLAAFAGGMVTALLLTPRNGKENLKWISEQSKDTKDWLEDKSQKIVQESEKKIDRVSKGIKKTINDALPDLYEATEGLNFSNHKTNN